VIDKSTLRTDDVADRDEREAHAVWATRERILGSRASRALAATENVGANHKSMIGIDCPAGADEG